MSTGGMETYVRSRLTIDARHAIELAKQQASIEHNGLKGRFRELVAQNLLKPWLPPNIGVGTGTVIHGTKPEFRASTQDDLLIYDQTIMPSVLIEDSASEGVYLNNAVLMRIEIKSRLTRRGVVDYLAASREHSAIGFASPPGAESYLGDRICARSALLAFESDVIDPSRELIRYKELIRETSADPRSASIFLSIGNGLFMIRPHCGNLFWFRLKSNDPAEQLACFTAIISTTAVSARMERTGVDPNKSLQAGIGLLFPSEDEWKVVDTV